MKITAPLAALIMQLSHSYPPEAKAKQAKPKRNTHILHRQQDETAAADLKSTLPSMLKRAMEVSSEKGASSWLSTLLIAEHGFTLHKGEFRDALCLRYGWRPPRLQRGFFDVHVRVFNSFVQSHVNTTITQCYRKNELEKKRSYDERVREIEHGSFSPPVFSTSGGMGTTATVVYKRLASTNTINPTVEHCTGSDAKSTSHC